MEEQSRFLRLNATDLKKVLKGAGIAGAGMGLVFVLGIFDVLDADAMTAIYTAAAGVIVNMVAKILSGPTH